MCQWKWQSGYPSVLLQSLSVTVECWLKGPGSVFFKTWGNFNHATLSFFWSNKQIHWSILPNLWQGIKCCKYQRWSQFVKHTTSRVILTFLHVSLQFRLFICVIYNNDGKTTITSTTSRIWAQRHNIIRCNHKWWQTRVTSRAGREGMRLKANVFIGFLKGGC